MKTICKTHTNGAARIPVSTLPLHRSSHLNASLFSSCWDTLNIYNGVSKLLNFYHGVSKLYCSCCQLSAFCLSGCHFFFLSHSFSISASPPAPLPLSLSLSLSLSRPSGPLPLPINRPVGGDGGPLRETEHFGWFPEKGNDRPRQYLTLHLLQAPSALLTRLEANTQRT